jgi:hypothetical protein
MANVKSPCVLPQRQQHQENLNFEARVKPAASKPSRQNKGRLLAWIMLIEFSEKKTYFVKVVGEGLFCHWMGLVVES